MRRGEWEEIDSDLNSNFEPNPLPIYKEVKMDFKIMDRIFTSFFVSNAAFI